MSLPAIMLQELINGFLLCFVVLINPHVDTQVEWISNKADIIRNWNQQVKTLFISVSLPTETT
jgi:hypothetical protein